MGADAGHVGALCAQGAESPRCDLGPESLTSAEGLQKTKEAKAKLQLQLAALLDESDSTGAPDSELSARGLRKDLKDLQDEDRKDLQDRGRAQDEDPKDIVTRILRRELELIRALKHAAEGVFNWIFFAIAAMQEGVSIDWPYARGFTFCQQDCIRLNGIIERAIKQPKDPDPKDPKQKCARGYFLGSVARLIAEAIEDDKERAASLAHSKDFWKCDRKCKAVAERISYPWKPCEMFAKYDPRTPAPRFERLSRKGA
jgi:hypothetical protein